MAGAAASELSRGGMRTKLDAGKIATAAGTAMIITSGARQNPLTAIERGERFTLFQPSRNPVKGYKTWIAGNLEPAGRLTVDAGAIGALLSGKSLLPAGVKLVSGSFSRGDTVAILSPEGREIARGLVAYDAAGCRKDRRTEDRRDRGRARLRGALGHGAPRRPRGEPRRRGSERMSHADHA